MNAGQKDGIEGRPHPQAGNGLVQQKVFSGVLVQVEDDNLRHGRGNEQYNQAGYDNVRGRNGMIHRSPRKGVCIISNGQVSDVTGHAPLLAVYHLP